MFHIRLCLRFAGHPLLPGHASEPCQLALSLELAPRAKGVAVGVELSAYRQIIRRISLSRVEYFGCYGYCEYGWYKNHKPEPEPESVPGGGMV